MGPCRLIIGGYIYCWAARWWMSPSDHRKLLATVLKKLNWIHKQLRFKHKWFMSIHIRLFKALLR